MIPHDDVRTLQPNPVYLFAKEVNTVEELETLFQDSDFVIMHTLMLRERILDPNHIAIESGLLYRSELYRREGDFRRSIDILKYAYQLQNARAVHMTDRGERVLYDSATIFYLCVVFFEMRRVWSSTQQEVQFQDQIQRCFGGSTDGDVKSGRHDRNYIFGEISKMIRVCHCCL